MSKKKFKYGLESLFDHTEDQVMTAPAFTQPVSSHEVAGNEADSSSHKRSPGKNFTADLDTLFQEALRETVEDQLKRTIGVNELPPETGQSVIKTLNGLDALIRSTTDDDDVPSASYKPTKRVTFVFEQAKLDKLKYIARQERSFLKDILNQIISGYIAEYERNNGIA